MLERNIAEARGLKERGALAQRRHASRRLLVARRQVTVRNDDFITRRVN